MNDQAPTSIAFTFEEDQPQRLDKFLVAHLPELSRSRIQDLIKNAKVLVDGMPASKTGLMLTKLAQIQVEIPANQPSGIIPEAIPLDVVFENEDLLVVNKPAGMVVHPAAGHSSGTLVHAALAHAPVMEGIGGELRSGVVHRLDKDTSGLLLLAKNDRTHRYLQDQFRLQKIQKTYLALVDGAPPTPSGRIEAPIGRDVRSRKKMAIVSAEKGRQAVSEYWTRETFQEHTLLEVHPITGRTHQIRLHLAFIHCPVAGDTIYGRTKRTIPIKRQFLHAWRLTFQLPGEKEPRSLEAPLSIELDDVLLFLRSK